MRREKGQRGVGEGKRGSDNVEREEKERRGGERGRREGEGRRGREKERRKEVCC